MPGARGNPHWSTRAFGIPLRFELGDVPGLDPRPAGQGAPTVVAGSRGTWSTGGDGVERAFTQRTPDGRVVATLDRDPAGDYLLDTPGFGRFTVSADGMSVGVDAGTLPPWRWQRMLLGHGIPLAAMLRGVEILHASAVTLPAAPARAIGLVAPSHGGKTSLAVQLVRSGAAFLTDDALALRLEGGRVVAEPGGGTASVRNAEVERIDADGRGWPGRVAARDLDSVRLVLERGGPAPLEAIYLIERDRGVPAASFDEIPAEPRRLLASSFNFVLRTPERLARQLDVCAAIAAQCSVVRVGVPPQVDAAGLAAAILDHALATRAP